MKFSEVLNSLMVDNNISIKELAKNTNINIATFYYYFKHQATPDVDSAIKICEFFNCSIHYLLGLTEEDNIKLKNTNKKFIENYEFLLKYNQVTNYKVCNDLNINRNSLYNWRCGKPNWNCQIFQNEYRFFNWKNRRILIKPRQ